MPRLVPLHEYNTCHNPQGPGGGQFCGRAAPLRVVGKDGPFGLAAEARKAGSFEAFRRDFLIEIKHGLYYHYTREPTFTVDPAKGPRDMSSLADGQMDAGKLMVTTDLDAWEEYGNRKYVAILDMTEVPREAYRQVNRGFGNEFYVSDPARVKVLAVVPVARARQLDKRHQKALPDSDEALRAFYDRATQGRS